jgi:hypothetical protein
VINILFCRNIVDWYHEKNELLKCRMMVEIYPTIYFFGKDPLTLVVKYSGSCGIRFWYCRNL